MNYRLTTKSNKIEVNLAKRIYEVSLSRTGGQGSRGISVVNAELDVNGFLIMTMSDGSTINAGYVGSLDQLADIAFSGSLDDIVGGELTTGAVQGGSF
jgi:hypothetical protein